MISKEECTKTDQSNILGCLVYTWLPCRNSKSKAERSCLDISETDKSNNFKKVILSKI